MFLFPQKLTLEKFIGLVKNRDKIGLNDAAAARIEAVRTEIKKITESGKSVYGINTGFGGLSGQSVSRENLKKLQKNLILSHAAGVGNPLPPEVSRGILLLLINSLSKGYSGISLATLKTLIKIYNRGIAPYIPEKGSVGASGDLAPLAHLALLLLGKGKAFYKNKIIGGKEVLKLIREKPLKLGPKEGLALINGTHAMASLLAFCVSKALNLGKSADIAGAMSFEALGANPVSLNPEIQELKPYKGQAETAANLRLLTRGSRTFREKNSPESGRKQIQDAYSLRCIPQVHGASKDAVAYALGIIETELNSVTDNPLFIEGKFMSGGNFHGQSLAMAADFLAIAVSELSDISERRIDRLINPLLNDLSPFLAKDSGLNCGFMVAQYTAAALVSYNTILSHPAVCDSIPTSAQQEDHVSMGMNACLKLREVLENCQKVAAIEILCAAQALDLQKNKKFGRGTKAAWRLVRQYVPTLEEDRVLADDIEKINGLIENEEVKKAAEKAVGKLKPAG